jgi:hypothetical protein
MENTVQSTQLQRKPLRFTPPRFKLLIISLLMTMGFGSSLFASPTEDVNAKILLVSDISCDPSEKIYFKVVPLEEYPNSIITIINITSVSPSGLNTVVAGENPDEFGIQAAGLKNYKIEGNIKVEFNNESIELPFQSALRLEGYSVSLNNTTTTYNSTSEVKTIAVTNPVLGLTYEWYDYDLTPYLNSATVTSMPIPYMIGGPGGIAVPQQPVATGTSYNAPYNNGEKLYIIGVTQNRCITSQVTSYKQLVVPPPPPPFEVVTGKFTLKQNCEAENANFIRPIRKDGSSEGLNWKWISYPVNDSYVAEPNKDLNLNKLKDGEAIVEVTDLDNNQIETLIFRIWGTESKYWGSINSTTNVITWNNVNLYGDLVVIKQFDENDLTYAQKISYYAQNYGCQYTKFKIAANTKVLVLSGNKAFNRLLFLNNNEIEIGKGVEITSGCNMWGGIVIHEKSSLAIKGNKEQPVSISNANHAILLNYPNRPTNAPWINNQQFKDADGYYFNVATGNNQALIQVNYTNFHNNYFHIYCIQELRNGSYTSNSKFTCNPDLMLPPYEPQLINDELQKFQTEACIVGYDGEKTYGETEYQHQGFFPTYNTINGVSTYAGVNISNCEFSNAFFGIRMPYQTKFASPNKYKDISLAAIAFLGWHLDLAEYEVSNQDITLPTNLADSDYLKYFQYQSVNLEDVWDWINGYNSTPNVSITDSEEQGLASLPSSERSRVGLSIGRPDVFTTDVSTTIDAPMNYTFGIISDNMVSAAGYFGTNRAIIFRNNRISSSDPFDASKWNFHYGIYAGGIKELSNNRFFDLNYAASGQVGRFETSLQGNYFYNNVVSSRFFALEPLSGTILPFKMSCNIYDFDKASNTNQTFRGLVFSGAANVPIITGTYDLPIIIEDPSGNIFPTKHSNRELLPYNLITEASVDVNATHSTTSSQHWESPDNWVSITNYTQSLTNPAVPNNTIYHRFRNEFIGRTFPDHFQPNSAIALAAASPNRYAYTSANDATNLEGDQYVKVCDNSDAAGIIAFPTVSAFVNKPKTPDFGKDKLIISQSELAKEITLGTQQNQVIVDYQLIDASGKLVRASESKSASITFSSNGLPTGFYSVILKTEKSVLTSKLIIQ